MTLSIRLSEDEMEQLQQQAGKMGISLSEYARHKLVGSSDGKQVEELFEQAKNLIKVLSEGEEFTLRQLFGVSWNQIPNSLRLLLGKFFNKQIENGQINNIQKTNRKYLNSQLYKKYN